MRAAIVAATLALAPLAACDRTPSVASCADHLGGVWVSADGAARWHILDGGARLEAYPLVKELPPAPAGAIAAPARLDLRRTGAEVVGTVARRWQHGAALCVVRAPARIRGCAADRLTLIMDPTTAPADLAACAPPAGAATTLLLRRTWP